MGIGNSNILVHVNAIFLRIGLHIKLYMKINDWAIKEVSTADIYCIYKANLRIITNIMGITFNWIGH